MAEYRARLDYTDMAKDALEIGGSFIASGFTGRYVEQKLKPDVSPTSPVTDKIIAGLANNIPKVAVYWIAQKIGLKGASAAVMGSVGFDVLIRATNNGVNPASVYIKNYRVLQSNELKSMEKIPDWAARQRQFGAMPFYQHPQIVNRQRKYGAMPFEQSPEKIARQRQFGQMSLNEMGFKPDFKDDDIHRMFDMR